MQVTKHQAISSAAKNRQGVQRTTFDLDADQPSGAPVKHIDPETDGRNKEWQDRSRVNLEEVPEGTQTNIERDFEPETSGDGTDVKEDKRDTPAY